MRLELVRDLHRNYGWPPGGPGVGGITKAEVTERFRSLGYHEFTDVAIEQEKFRALTLLSRDDFNLFSLLPTDLLHQV